MLEPTPTDLETNYRQGGSLQRLEFGARPAAHRNVAHQAVFDLQAKYAEVISLGETRSYLAELKR